MSTELQTARLDLGERLHQMLRVRRFEERCAELYSAAKIRGFLHLYIGEEAVAAGIIPELGPEDAVVSSYREHGHALVRGVPMRAVMAEMLGKVEGCSHGRGGSMHLFDAQRRLFGGNAIVAGGIPLAVGLALADVMQDRHQVTACFFGDGAVAEGAFHEAANLAALWQLPVLFCCENNLYAMGTALSRRSPKPPSRSRLPPTRSPRGRWTAWISARWPTLLTVRSNWSAVVGRCFLSSRRTGSGHIPCSIPTATDRRTRSRRGSDTTRFRRYAPRSRLPGS